jgi:outer membrane protein assembly factor BamB
MDDPEGRKELLSKEPETAIGEFFKTFDGIPSESTASWPRFRGSYFDNISRDNTPLSTDWPENGPPVLWSLELGEGHAAPAVCKGRVFILDYLEDIKADALRCFSLMDGREIWRRSYKVHVKRNHGMTRTIPAVTDKYVLTMGPRCHTMCVDMETGDYLWGVDMVRDYGTTVPGWHAGQCPLIDNGIAVLAPAGTNVLMMGVDCATGNTIWSTPNPNQALMSHSSIIPMTILGRNMYVYSAIGLTVGVAADGPDTGRILWQTTEWNPSVITPSPVLVDDGKILLTAGYAAGSMMIKVTETNGTFSVETIYRKTPREGLCSEQQTPLYYDGHVFSIQPKDAGSLRKQFVCYLPDGTMVWSSGKEHLFGLGPFMIADNKFLILDDYGVLTCAELSTSTYVPLAQAKIMDGHDSWGPFALVEGKLLLRDSKKLVCLDLKAKQ